MATEQEEFLEARMNIFEWLFYLKLTEGRNVCSVVDEILHVSTRFLKIRYMTNLRKNLGWKSNCL